MEDLREEYLDLGLIPVKEETDPVYERKMESIKKAQSYRIAALLPAQKLPKVAKKTVKRNKKGKSSGDTQSDAYTGVTSGDRNAECDDDEYFEDALDFTEEDIRRASRHFDLDPSQSTYKQACHILNIVPAAFFLRHLPTTEITMRNHHLGPKGAKACARALLNNCSVRTLNLGENELGTEGATYMVSLLKENHFLTSLKLDGNNFGSKGARLFGAIMEENESLRILDLSNNGFEENDAVYFSKMLQENNTLTELRLDHNAFRENGGVVLAKAIETNVSLELLGLRWNHLRMKGAVALSNALKKNIGLLTLDLAWNGFGLEGSMALSEALKANHNLTDLDLTCNRIDFECLGHIVKGLSSNDTLNIIRLGQNPISTEGAMLLLTSISNIPQINELDISGQCVDSEFLNKLYEIQRERSLKVKHGLILRQDEFQPNGRDDFLDEDPMVVLMEFMRLKQLRLVDLFKSMDNDGSWSLSKKEIKEGLMSVNIPLSSMNLDRLINRLDADNNGEIDFKELIEGQKKHRRRSSQKALVAKMKGVEDAEIPRVRDKLQTLMMAQSAFRSSLMEKPAEIPTSDSKNKLATRVLNKLSKKKKEMTPVTQMTFTSIEETEESEESDLN